MWSTNPLSSQENNFLYAHSINSDPIFSRPMSNQNTVFIRDIPANTPEEDIRNSFSGFGNIQEVYLNTKNQTAKVTFSTHEEAQRAIDGQKNININGHNVKVILNHGSLLLTNLPNQITEDQLKIALRSSPFLHITLKNNNQALVTYETQQIANEQMPTLNNLVIGNQKLVAKVYHAQQRIDVPLPPYMVLLENQDPPQPLPPKAYGSLKTVIGTILFYPEDDLPTPKPKDAADGQRTPQLTKVRQNILNECFRYLEERTIFVDGFEQGTTVDVLKAHFSQKGEIANVKIHSTKAAIIQYIDPESRVKALELRKTTLPNQRRPLAVLPYIEKRIPHKESGLIQINELPPTTKVENLTEEFSAYGQILATSISPTGFDEPPYGFVLFALYEQALNAKQAFFNGKYPNIFLYPPIQAHESILAFTESAQAPNNCLAIYDLPMTTLEPQINEECRKFGFIQSSFVLSDGQTKTSFEYFSDTENAIKAYSELSKQNRHVDILNGNALSCSFRALKALVFPGDWNSRILYLGNLPKDFGTSQLRKILIQYNIGIDSCFVPLNPTTGTSSQAGVVLLNNFQQGAWLIQNFGLIIRGATASFFRSRGGYQVPDQVQNLRGSKYKIPQHTKTPRETMKQFVRLNFPENQQQVLIDKISNLSVIQTRQMDFPTFVQWIESEANVQAKTA